MLVVALAGALAFVGVHYANTGKQPDNPLTNEPAQLVDPPLEAAALSSDDRDAVRAVAAKFVDTAVLRRHVDGAWEITTAKLRQGLTRKQWDTGAIPVAPFPAEEVRTVKYQVDWSGENLVYLKIAIMPKSTSEALGQAYDIGLRRRADHQTWLVDYWVPAGVGVAVPGTKAAAQASAAAPDPNPKARIPVGFIFVPIGVLIALIVGLPAVIFGRHWLRGRRALREYHRHQV